MQRGAWLALRLRAMGPSEIRARAGRELGRGADTLERRLARSSWDRRWHPQFDRIATAPASTRPLGFLTVQCAAEVKTRIPAAVDGICSAAERAVAGDFQFFGYDAVRLERPLDFTRDPFSGRSWPERFGPWIDYRHSEIGDPKWIWELNRCQHLPLLIEAWLLSQDERFLDCAVRDLTDWIDTHTVGRGIAWANGFEAALRAMSFAACYDALRGSDRLTGAAQDAVLLSLWQHARWISREPSTHSSANNHRIGELVGLAVIGVLVPELRGARALLHRSLDELSVEVDRQIRPDGTSAEQSFAYHVFVVDLLLMLVGALTASGREVPEPLRSALTRSADAFALQVSDNEPSPTYGDDDEGRAFRYDGGDRPDVRSVAAALAAFLGHAGARRVAGSLQPAAAWLFGGEGAARFDTTPPGLPPGNAFLPDGGLVALRNGKCRVLFDVGPLGYGPLAAHGHADALEVTLAQNGIELVVDPGVGSYFGHPDWRSAFRGTGFHPTVAVDASDQSESGGPFLWRRHATTHAELVDLEHGVAIGQHDGYARLRDTVSHVRAVAVLPDGPVLVVDRLRARAEHRFSQGWPLHPRLDARLAAPDVLHATDQREPRFLAAFASLPAGHVELVRGQEQPLCGWWSERLEARQAAWHCRWQTDAAGLITVVALLYALQDEPWPDPAISLATSGEDARVEFNAGHRRRRVVVSFSPANVTFSAVDERSPATRT